MTNSSIKLIKLLNGEELMAEVLPQNSIYNGKIHVKNVVRVVVMPNKIDPKTPNIGFAPWMDFSDDKEFSLNDNVIMCMANPIKEFLQQYQSMFGKIVTPTTGGLILPS